MVALALAALFGQAAAAAEITLLSAGAVEPGIVSAVAAFEKQTQHVVKIAFNTVPQIRDRVTKGARADVVVATPAVLDEFGKAGLVEKERASVGRVSMGVAVRAGSRVPDVSSSEALKRTILAADTLAYTRGSSGLYFEGLLKKMGIEDQIRSKVRRYDTGALVFEYVLSSKGHDIGVGQITEIRLYREKGLQLVGPLSPDVQNQTSYDAAAMPTASNPAAAREFVRFLASSAAKALFTAAGIE
jgi:molybdate transport system substrate-binding protein